MRACAGSCGVLSAEAAHVREVAAHHGREALRALLLGRVRVLATLPVRVAFSLVAGVPEHFTYESTTTPR
ncbi:MAG: hypothetical protein QOF36_2505 [Microbacteriaceae bacterium]|jgi:hypothetical protein|nr:hypothetical protein [Microbacteriaceae bacterium]